MLAAAHEKTGEIGILLALGAQPHDIRRTFLLQAVLLCLFGGIVGLAAAGALLHFGAALLLPEGRVFAGLLTLSTLSGAAAGLFRRFVRPLSIQSTQYANNSFLSLLFVLSLTVTNNE